MAAQFERAAESEENLHEKAPMKNSKRIGKEYCKRERDEGQFADYNGFAAFGK